MDSNEIDRKLDINGAVAFAMGIEGMTIKEALILMSVFIERVHPIVEPGKIVEFGTYKGRVAALLGKTARENDSLVLVDFKQYLEFDKFDDANIKYKFHESTSEDWCRSSENSGRFFFSHHDASHFFDNVSTEILSLEKNMDTRGVMVLDDFTDTYNQVRAAYYHARYARDFGFELLLIGFGKAFLVHSSEFEYWESFVLDRLQNELKKYGLDSTLSRTDINKLSRAFSIRNKKNEEDPDRYGIHIWGEKYYKKSGFLQ